jgi:hypothetical protein
VRASCSTPYLDGFHTDPDYEAQKNHRKVGFLNLAVLAGNHVIVVTLLEIDADPSDFCCVRRTGSLI